MTSMENTTAEHGSSYAFAVRDMTAEHHIRVVSPREYRLFEGKRKIVIFPGGKTNSLEIGNGMCKLTEREFFPELYIDEKAENLSSKQKLQLKKVQHRAQKLRDDFEICVLVYHNRNFVLQAYEFFDDCIVPAVAKVDANKDLHRLDFEEAVANMRHFAINTHCYGGFIIKAIDRDLKELLPKIGYAPEESAAIARQCVVFDHSNIDEALGNTEPCMSYIRRLTLQDNVLDYTACRPGTYQRFIKGEKYPFERPSFDILSGHEGVLLTPTLCKNSSEAHNGYWNSADTLTETGREERMVFEGLAKEVISNKDRITDLKDLVASAADKKGPGMQIITESIENGKQHMQSFEHYRHQVELVTQMSVTTRHFR